MSENSSRLRYIELPNNIIKCPLCDFQRSANERKLVYNHTFKKHQIKITTKILKSPEQIEDQLIKSRRLINERVKRHRLMKAIKVNSKTFNNTQDENQSIVINNSDHDTNSMDDENMEELIKVLDRNNLDLFNFDNLSDDNDDIYSTNTICDQDLVDNNSSSNDIVTTNDHNNNHNSTSDDNNFIENQNITAYIIQNEDQHEIESNIDNNSQSLLMNNNSQSLLMNNNSQSLLMNNNSQSLIMDNNSQSLIMNNNSQSLLMNNNSQSLLMNNNSQSLLMNDEIQSLLMNDEIQSLLMNDQVYSKHCRSRSSTYGIEVNSVTSNNSIVIPPPKKKSKNIVTRFFRKISKNILGNKTNKSPTTAINRSRDNSASSMNELDTSLQDNEIISNHKSLLVGNNKIHKYPTNRSRDNSVNSMGMELMQEEIIPTPTISPNTSMKLTATTTSTTNNNNNTTNNASNIDDINNSSDWNTSTSNSYLSSLFDRFKTLE